MNFSFWPFLWFGLPGRLLINGTKGFPQNLRLAAVFCENLRFPAVFFENLRLRSAVVFRKKRFQEKNEKLQKSAKNCEFGSVCAFDLAPCNYP